VQRIGAKVIFSRNQNTGDESASSTGYSDPLY